MADIEPGSASEATSVQAPPNSAQEQQDAAKSAGPDIPTFWAKAAQARQAGYSWDDINTAALQKRQELMGQGYSGADVDAANRMDAKGNIVPDARVPGETGWTYQAEAATGSQSATDVWRNLAAPAITAWQGIADNIKASLPSKTDAPPGFLSWDSVKQQAGELAHFGGAIAGIANLVTAPFTGILNAAIVEPGAAALAKGFSMLPGQMESSTQLRQEARGDIQEALMGMGHKGGFAAIGEAGEMGWAVGHGAPAPAPEEFVDGAIAAHGPVPPVPEDPAGLTLTMKNMGDIWAMDGESPAVQAQRANSDATFRSRLISRPPVPIDASVTATGNGDHVILKQPAPVIDTGNPVVHGYQDVSGIEDQEYREQARAAPEELAPQEAAAPEEQVAMEEAGRLANVVRQRTEDDTQETKPAEGGYERGEPPAVPNEFRVATNQLIPFTRREIAEDNILSQEGFEQELRAGTAIRMGYTPPDSDAGKIFGPNFETYSPRDLVRLNVLPEGGEAPSVEELARARVKAARIALRRAARGRKGRGTIYGRGAYQSQIPVTADGRAWTWGRRSAAGGPPEPPDFGMPNYGRIPPREEPPLLGQEARPMRVANPEEVIGRKIVDAPKESWSTRISGTVNRLYYDLVNDDHPINKLAEASQSKRAVSDMENIKFLRKLAQKASTTAKGMLLKGMVDREGNIIGPSLKDSIFDAANDADTLNAYLVSERALDLAKQGKESPFSEHLEEAQQVADKYRDTHIGAAARMVWDFHNDTLRFAASNDMMSQAALEQTIADNPHPTPFFHHYDPFEGRPAKSTTGKLTRQYLGSARPIRDPIRSIVENTFKRTIVSTENRMALAMLNEAEPLGLATVRNGPLANIDPAEWTDINIDPDQEGWENAEDARAKSLESFSRFAATKGLRPDETPVFRDGKMLFVKWADPLLTRVLRHYDSTSLSIWSRVAHTFTKLERALITKNPAFAARNFWGDLSWQFVLSPEYRNTVREAVSGAWHGLTGSDMFEEWSHTAAAESLFDGLSGDKVMQNLWDGIHEDKAFGMRAMNAVSSVPRAVFSLMHYVTTAQRVGRYAAERAAGASKTRAAVSSMGAVFHDPSFGGAQSRAWNRVSAFLLASMNGLDQSARGQFGFGENALGQRSNPAVFAAKAAAVYTVPYLLNYAMFHDDKRYQAAPMWQKMSGLVIPIMGSPEDPNSGHTIYIPSVARAAVVYGGIPVALMSHFMQHERLAASDLVKGFVANFFPGSSLIVGDMLLPFAEWATNHSMFGNHPLVPDDAQRQALPAEQGTANTSPTAIAVSRFMSDAPLLDQTRMAPQVVQNFIQDWGGEDILNGLDHIMRAAGVAPRMAGLTSEQLPLFHSFQVRHPGMYTKPYDDFEATMVHINQVHGSLAKLWESGDIGRFEKILKENPTAAAMHALLFRGPNGIAAQANSQQFIQALQQSEGNFMVAHELVGVSKTLENLKKAAHNFAALGEAKRLTPLQVQRALDNTYARMMQVSQYGESLAQKAGVQ